MKKPVEPTDSSSKEKPKPATAKPKLFLRRDMTIIAGWNDRTANESLLSHQDYFGQFGQIRKILVTKERPPGRDKPEFTAAVIFANELEASLALLALEDAEVDGRPLRASFGAVKQCPVFLSGQMCHAKDCLGLHRQLRDSEVCVKDEANAAKSPLKLTVQTFVETILPQWRAQFRARQNEAPSASAILPSPARAVAKVLAYLKEQNLTVEGKPAAPVVKKPGKKKETNVKQPPISTDLHWSADEVETKPETLPEPKKESRGSSQMCEEAFLDMSGLQFNSDENNLLRVADKLTELDRSVPLTISAGLGHAKTEAGSGGKSSEAEVARLIQSFCERNETANAELAEAGREFRLFNQSYAIELNLQALK